MAALIRQTAAAAARPAGARGAQWGRRAAAAGGGQRRTFLGRAVKKMLGFSTAKAPDAPTVENRFHPWEQSPAADLRARAGVIKEHAKCPVSGLNIAYSCPDCGIPTHHSRAEWEADTHHKDVCGRLKLSNVYEHDLRSGREFPEFDLPLTQDNDTAVNFSSWDNFLYTRNFYSMDTEFQLAAITKVLTYPITTASVLHQNSTYQYQAGRSRLTVEGMKSLAALRYTMHPFGGPGTPAREGPVRDEPVRIFVLGARSEALLPPDVWAQMLFLFPKPNFHLYFIGPETLYDYGKQQFLYEEKPVVHTVAKNLRMTFYTEYFHVLHERREFLPFDPYHDVFMLFHPGLGAPEAMEQWSKSMPALLESKCPIFVTGFHEEDSRRDWDWVMDKYEDDLDVLLKPGPNVFASTKWEIDDLDPSSVHQVNQQIFGIRGKRYHAIPKNDVFSLGDR
ncbi:zinc-finger of mitochondrial splicing suppressor 51-domain-containing protein [Dipodascopsis tothii]|uniref:zinc-finger of mitochondrial splicing suppressor 51-domain-containing protein n=1 Tax=Dipodascopsis tothii TaxID=44089 RepID=UPI0034CDAA78